jgi:formylmethanofuran dehydrogenase subunit E
MMIILVIMFIIYLGTQHSGGEVPNIVLLPETIRCPRCNSMTPLTDKERIKEVFLCKKCDHAYYTIR